MPTPDTTTTLLPARYYALLAHRICGPDLPAHHLLEPIGLDLDALEKPGAMLSIDQVDSFLERAASLSGRDDLGLQLGRMIKPSSHEYLGYALMTSANLDEALQLASRYWRLITPAFNLKLAPDPRGVCIDLEPCVVMSLPSLRFHIETIATAFHEELRFLLSGQVPAYDVFLPAVSGIHPRIRHWLAPARVHYGAQGNTLRMILPRQATEQPLALADKTALKIARQRCDEAIAHMTVQGSLSDRVKLMHEQSSDHQPRQHELARILHISTRTMNRRLAAEGSCFRQLGKLSRQARARQLLVESQLSITRIALQLGYRDVANFSRAFRIENGITPAAFRRRNGSA